MPASTVKPGTTILHPASRIPLRVVRPKNFGIPRGDAAGVENDTVFAVDDESGLYALHPDQPVEIPFNVPLVTRADQDSYLVIASFERHMSDDLPVMRRNFREGRITADPYKDRHLAAMQQLSLEVDVAYDEGMAGLFQGHRAILDRAFDRPAMGWRRAERPRP